MNMIPAVLINEGPDALKTLQVLVKKCCPEVEILATFSDAQTAIGELPELNPELLFLDVQMRGMTGFELLKQFAGFSGSVIFVAAQTDQAIEAIKFSALDYLLKPIDTTELKQAVEKYKKMQAAKLNDPVLQQLARDVEFLSHPAASKITVSTQQGFEIVLLADVDYMQALRNYTLVKRHGKKDLLVCKPLKDFEETLFGGQFMRINNSFIVNLQKVQRYIRADGGYVIMEDGTQITVSRSHKDGFIHFLKALEVNHLIPPQQDELC